MAGYMASSQTDRWATPRALFDRLHAHYHFTLDAAADAGNALLPDYYTAEQDALKQLWTGRVYCNPPYGADLWRWVVKAFMAYAEGEAELVVMLLPARTDTEWFHFAVDHMAELHFFKGRLHFGDGANGAPFPSLLLAFVPRDPITYRPALGYVVRGELL